MSQTNEALLRRYVELYNDRSWDELRELLTDDYVHHSNDAALTAQQFVRGAEWIFAGIPDFHAEILDVVDGGGRAAVRFIGSGTHRNSMFGEAPSGGPIALHGTTIYRIEDGRIAEDWEQMDEGELRRQAGAPGFD